MMKYAYVFVPTASSLEGAGQGEEVGRLAVKATRFGLLICLPVVLFLMFLGGDLLDLWMGGRYANGRLIAVLAGVHFFSIAYLPLFFVLSGINGHGRAGVVLFVGAGVGAGLAFLWLRLFHGGLVGTTLAAGLPWVLVNGIYLPIHACKRLGLSLREFFAGAWKKPLLCALPYLACLLAVRMLHLASALQTLVWSAFLGGGVLTVLYWMFAVPGAQKRRIVARLSFRQAAAS